MLRSLGFGRRRSAGRCAILAVGLAVLVSPLAPLADAGQMSAHGKVVRWFPRDRRLNSPIPAGAAIDPNSAAMIRLASTKDQLAIDVREWTVPVYYATASTRRYDVKLLEPDMGGKAMLNVPIPAGAAPDPMKDAHMAVIDRPSGCVFEFYHARKLPDGHWVATWGDSKRERRGLATYADGGGTRGSGFSAIAGLIRPEELRAGVIRHALVFDYRNTKAGGPVPPATRSDGWSSDRDAIPMGARLRLDPRFPIRTLPYRWQRTIARALQLYGMYLVDTGTDAALIAQNPQSYRRNPYPWGGANFAFLPGSVLRSLQVLKLSRQYQAGRGRESQCARVG